MTKEVAKHIVVGLIRAGLEANQAISATLKPYDLTLQQFNVLRILRGQKGKMATLMDVQSKMIHKMSNTTRIIDRLIEKNLVDREVCADNRRKIDLCITPSGLDLLQQLDPLISSAEENFVAQFDPESRQALTQLFHQKRIV
ncbi:MAG: MarR family winged helix-turn-helix transcriptional regulator [Flavobacteriaceae bacterium]